MNNDPQFAEALEDCAVDAALYALGTLPREKAGAVEQRLRSGCPFCSAQAEHYAAVAEHRSLAAAPVEPRPEVRQRLLDRIKPRDAAPQAFEQRKIVRGNDAPWVKMPTAGVEMRPLIGDKTFLVRMQPGTVFPKHDHAQAEQCYVLEGAITDSDGTTLRAGDFVVMSSGTQHEPIHTDSGCTLFIVYAD
jgi:quercetin dioxygenase-like cupin family protein